MSRKSQMKTAEPQTISIAIDVAWNNIAEALQDAPVPMRKIDELRVSMMAIKQLVEQAIKQGAESPKGE